MTVDPEQRESILARHDGKCPWCREEIHAWSDDIALIRGRGWAHSKCARNAEEIAAVHAEHEEREPRDDQ